MSTYDQLPQGKPLLAVSQPGHEVRVHHWLELARPDVIVLTDGSGRDGAPRLNTTAALLDRVGARPAPLFGAVTDRDLYDAVLLGDVALLAELTRAIARQIDVGRYHYVLGDAAEYLVPVHEVFRAMLDAAVEIARRDTGRTIFNLDFPLDGPSDAVHPLLRSRAYFLELDGAAMKRKVASACDFASSNRELEAVLRRLGTDRSSVECLRPAFTEAGLADLPHPSACDVYGDYPLAVAGYDQAVRYAAHVRPLLEKLHLALGLADAQIHCAA